MKKLLIVTLILHSFLMVAIGYAQKQPEEILKAGDMILEINRQPVKGQADFYRKVWALGSAGVKVPISILRDTEIKEITLNSIDRYQLFGPKTD